MKRACALSGIVAGSIAGLLLAGTFVVILPPVAAMASPTITSPAPGGPLNNNQSIESSPVSCGFSDPNGPFTFAPGLVGTAEPSTSMSLPSGSSDYFYVGSDAGGNPLSQISWSQDLGVTASYSGNQAISVGRATTDAGSFSSGSTTNVAIAGLAVSGYAVSAPLVTASTSTGTSVSLTATTASGDLLVVVVGGEGAGLLQQGGTALSTLLNVTYSECGSNVIASAGMFAAFLPAGTHSVTISGTTYPTNAGTSMGAVAYVLSPVTVPAVASVSPARGPLSGGNSVTIDGSGLAGATAVNFGTSSVTTFTADSASSITVDAPPAAQPGSVDVTVTGPTGTSAASTADLYTFLPGSNVAVSPSSLSFGLLPPGSSSPPQTITFTNDGADPVSVGLVSVGSGAGAGDFHITADTCASTRLSGAGSCTVGVTFAPPTGAAAGAVTQTVGFAASDAISGENLDQAVSVSATVEATQIAKIFPVAATTDPVLVVAGSGFGNNFPEAELGQSTDTSFLEVRDATQGWSAGYNGDGCSVTVTAWTDTEIVFTANVGGAAGYLAGCGAVSPGDKLVVTIWDTDDPGAAGARATGSTTLLHPGAAPSVTNVTPRYGPQAGGTVVTIDGTGFTNAEAVWFGPFLGASPQVNAAGTQITVTAPAAALPEGVSVLVTGSDGITSAASCVFLQTGCADAFFYLTPVGPTSPFTINQFVDANLSVTLGPPPTCLGQTTLSGDCASGTSSVQTGQSVGVSLTGPVDITIAGENPDGSMVDMSWNGGDPSAVVMAAKLTVDGLTELDAGVQANISGTLTVPIPLPDSVPGVISLNDVIAVEGGVSVDGSFNLATGDTVSVAGGAYNGQYYAPTTTTVCDGTPVVSPSQWQDCLTSAPEVTISDTADVTFSPLTLQLGPDNANISAGPEVGIVTSGGTATDGSSWAPFANLGVCFGLAWSGSLQLGPLQWQTEGVIPDPPVQVSGTGCPFGASDPASPTVEAHVPAARIGTAAAVASGLLQYAVSPARAPAALHLEAFYRAALGAQVRRTTKVARLSLCGAPRGSELFWLDRRKWARATPAGTVPAHGPDCLSYQIGSRASPSIADLGDGVILALGQPHSKAAIKLPATSVRAGTVVKLGLSGFNPEQLVTISWNTPTGRILRIVRTRRNGTATTVIRIPKVHRGTYTIFASAAQGPTASTRIKVTTRM
jgi:hypothetical protein